MTLPLPALCPVCGRELEVGGLGGAEEDEYYWCLRCYARREPAGVGSGQGGVVTPVERHGNEG